MKHHNEQFYIAKAIIISTIVAIIVDVIGFFAYKNMYTLLPEEFILFSTAFILSFAVIYAIVVGFIILIAFTRYQKFDDIISQELSCLGDMLDFTEYISEQDTIKGEIRNSVKNYGIAVANDEWSAISKGQTRLKVLTYLKEIIDSINGIDVTNDKNAIIFKFFIDKTAKLTTLRANRLEEANKPFPKLLMLTLYVVSVIFILATFFLFAPNVLSQIIFLLASTFTVSLVIQLIYDIGNPYKEGAWTVEKKDYETIKMSIVAQIPDTRKNKKI